MKWSETAWQQSAAIFEQIIEMPFNQELMAGTLDIEKFKFYISQDSNYLEHFGRGLALIAARTQTSYVLDYLRFAEGAIVVENALHANYFATFNISQKAELSPACHHYINYLLKEASLSQVEVAMAAVLPCFWIYKKVGDYIYANQTKNNNPYQSWIDTYAGEDFGKLVDKAIRICDEAALNCSPQQQQTMTAAFITGCRLEWLFWDSAWLMETWPG
ncbi:MAG: thiaminase II [Janthinobacterium lividum]